MKKNLYIFKSELMTGLQYVFDLTAGFISYSILIFIFLNLWQYVYGDPNELINGYSMKQMIWYVIITEILWMAVSGRKLCKRICNDVRSGNIAYNIIKPYDYIEYILFGHMGSIFIKGLLLTVLGMGLGVLFLGSFPDLTIVGILGVILVSFLALIINIFLILMFGLMSFYIEDATPFYWLYSKFILLVGTIFPIEFFPKMIQPIIRYSPIYVASYGPAKIFVDFKLSSLISVLIAQLIYILICYIIVHLIYRKGVRKLNVNGG